MGTAAKSSISYPAWQFHFRILIVSDWTEFFGQWKPRHSLVTREAYFRPELPLVSGSVGTTVSHVVPHADQSHFVREQITGQQPTLLSNIIHWLFSLSFSTFFPIIFSVAVRKQTPVGQVPDYLVSSSWSSSFSETVCQGRERNRIIKI